MNSPSLNSEQIKEAFANANAICALEGFVLTPDIENLQQMVIDGKIDFEQAVHLLMESAGRAQKPCTAKEWMAVFARGRKEDAS